MVPEYSPACTEAALKALYTIKDALRRRAFIEASNLVFDALVDIQNEYDWCYRTDPVLPFMREYFVELNTAISSLINATPDVKKAQASQLVTVIETTMRDVSVAHDSQPTHSAINGLPDRLERDDRLRVYSGRNL
jgi:hypothetical protein